MNIKMKYEKKKKTVQSKPDATNAISQVVDKLLDYISHTIISLIHREIP